MEVPPAARVAEAASGFYESDFWKRKYPRVQIITVLDVLKGKRPEMPWSKQPLRQSPNGKRASPAGGDVVVFRHISGLVQHINERERNQDRGQS